MNKFSTCILISLSCFFSASGQLMYIDSLLKTFHAEKLSELDQMNRLNVLSSDFIDAGEYKKAQICGEKQLELAKKIRNTAGEFAANINLGNIAQDLGHAEIARHHFGNCLTIGQNNKNEYQVASAHQTFGSFYSQLGDYPTALTHLTTSLAIRTKLNLKDPLIDNYTEIGNIHTNTGNYPEAIKNYLEVLRLAEELNDSDGMINAYNNMGVVSWLQENLDEALHYFQQSLAKAEHIKNIEAIANSTHNIGNVYFVQEKFDEAAPYYLQALQMREQLHDKLGMATSYNNIGATFEHQGKLEEAIQNYQKAMNLQRELDDQRGLTGTYLNLGSIQSRLGQYQMAIDTTKKGIDLAKALGIKDHVKEGYGILYDIYKQKKDFENAVLALEQYNVMKDSLLNESSAQSIADLKIQYETEKKEKQNLTLKLERDQERSLNALLQKENQIATLNFQNETGRRMLMESRNKQQQDSLDYLLEYQAVQDRLIQQEHDLRDQEKQIHQKEIQSRNLGLWLLAITLSMGGIVFYLILRVRKRRMDQQFKEIQEKALRAQLKPHFVFNAMGAIQNMVKSKPDIADRYLSKFSHFTQEVLVNSEKKQIPLSDEVAMITDYMDLQSLRLTSPVQYEFLYENQLDPEDVMVPPAILQPLVENSINHNFARKQGKNKLTFTFRVQDGMLLCLLQDQSEGTLLPLTEVPDKLHERKSFGRQIVEERLAWWSKGKSKKGFIDLSPKSNGMLVTMGIPL